MLQVKNKMKLKKKKKERGTENRGEKKCVREEARRRIFLEDK